MAHHLQHISDLAALLFTHGVEDVVVSPGSRNAPLIRAFYDTFSENCHSLVDERSAAYFALGQSLKTGKPSVLISTSGTAVLNYAPAVAEAFYQQVPLLIVTADRPAEWIGQQDNQAMQQENVYRNYIKASYSLPLESAHTEDIWMAHRTINEAFHKTLSVNPGPVHINVPLREPLYEELPEASKNLQIIQKEVAGKSVSTSGAFHTHWEKANSIMIVCGQLPPNDELNKELKRVAADPRVVVAAEPVSNLHESATIPNPEVTLNSKIKYTAEAIPELVIYFGGQVVSKKIKLFLRGLNNTKFWYITPEDKLIDTFQNLSGHLKTDPISALRALNVTTGKKSNAFKAFWVKEKSNALALTKKYTEEIAFSDLKVFKQLSELLPGKAIVFAGNSSIVRYLLYFDQNERKYYSNRGVSGIDGCISTAAGLASKTTKTVYAVVGDLAFIYDSNGLWNRQLPKNLKIILVNNEGGGIFHLLKGPSEHEAFLPFVNAHHPVNIEKLSEAFGVNYQCSSTEDELITCIESLKNSDQTEILEIKTPNNGEPQITRDFFKFLNKNYGTKVDNP
ncbi:2-succinyl-5-enolpyruvyl-6-hydroxy-3-cyclohexene-1-carboxylic-acid synthase [Maribellus mangrovi]|uniref:2-succinyl-5-enolpyruvyl-6-hydroxy-3- cyclohexene-1-carboxylic-acid synthase n=1 Tax=Maribellus mangrovi TaxID=3133146 RepID=UPI0030EBC983